MKIRNRINLLDWLGWKYTIQSAHWIGTRVHIHTCVCVYACVYVCVYMQIYMYMCVCLCVCRHVCVRVCLYVCMYVRKALPDWRVLPPTKCHGANECVMSHLEQIKTSTHIVESERHVRWKNNITHTNESWHTWMSHGTPWADEESGALTNWNRPQWSNLYIDKGLILTHPVCVRMRVCA